MILTYPNLPVNFHSYIITKHKDQTWPTEPCGIVPHPPLCLSASLIPSTLNCFSFFWKYLSCSPLQTICVPVGFAWNVLPWDHCLTGFALSLKIQLQTPTNSPHRPIPCHSLLHHRILFSSETCRYLKVTLPHNGVFSLFCLMVCFV